METITYKKEQPTKENDSWKIKFLIADVMLQLQNCTKITEQNEIEVMIIALADLYNWVILEPTIFFEKMNRGGLTRDYILSNLEVEKYDINKLFTA